MFRLLSQVRAGWLTAFALFWVGPRPAAAQFPSQGGSLGGYGASSGSAVSGMGGGGGTAIIIPYGGMAEGFMPGRAGGGSSLSFRPRSTASMGGSRPSLSLLPSTGSSGMGRGNRSRSAMSSRPGSRGMSQGGGGGGGFFRLGSGSGLGGSGVMPPSIGFPFRQPPSPTPASGGSGTSM